jgi:DNA-binding LacI/PurR family transcriptional regulator
LAAVNDMFAIGVIAGLREHGLSVPADDVSVVGSDDLFLAPRLNPPLTSVRLPFAEYGAAHGGAPRCPHQRSGDAGAGIPVSAMLVSRQSVAGPPPTERKRPAARRMRAP